MESNQIILLFKIVIFFGIFLIIVSQYIEAKIRKKNNKELQENMNKHITRVGALENDRVNERQRTSQ